MRIMHIFLFEHNASFSGVIDVFYYQRKSLPINKCRKYGGKKYDGNKKSPNNATLIIVAVKMPRLIFKSVMRNIFV